jgi:LPXTG-motif cell wall-anchored protein
MSFCIGGKWCRTQECKNRCKGWFGTQPDIERACKGACNTTSSLKKDDFLCSGDWIDQRVVFAAYGYDPCADDEVTIEDYFDPTGEKEDAKAQAESTNQLIYIVLGVLILSLGGLLLLKFKR